MDFEKTLSEYEKSIKNRYQRSMRAQSEKVQQYIKNASPHPAETMTIRERKRRGFTYYYQRNFGENNLDKEYYIPKSNSRLINLLLQNQYASKVAPYYETQLNLIHQLQAVIAQDTDRKFYDSLSEESKQHLVPLVPYEPDIIQEWLNQPFARNQYYLENAVHDSLRGDKLRSKSEVLIANALYHAGLPYFVDIEMRIDGTPMYPDFLILRPSDKKEFIWEHFGLMSDPIYVDNAVKKIHMYDDLGFHIGDNFIVTFENTFFPLSSTMVEGIIERWFMA